MKATGQVAEVEVKKTKTGKDIYIVHLEDGERYSAFGKPAKDLVEGTSVEIDYEESGQYKNIKGITTTKSKPEYYDTSPEITPANKLKENYNKKDVDWDGKERRMVRMSAIKSLCQLYSGKGKEIEVLLAEAEELVDWVYEVTEE